MTLPKALKSRLATLDRRFQNFKKPFHSYSDPGSDYNSADEEEPVQEFIKILFDLTQLIHKEVAKESSHLPELVESAHSFVKTIIKDVKDSEIIEFIPSWAHDEEGGYPLVKDIPLVSLQLPISKDAIRKLGRSGLVGKTEDELIAETTPKSWDNRMKKHSESSPLARHRPNLPALTPTAASSIATSVYDARCEVKSYNIGSPIQLCLSKDNTFLGVVSTAKNGGSATQLRYNLLGEENFDQGFRLVKSNSIKGATHMALDDSRKLILIGNDKTVKSFTWADPNGQPLSKLSPAYTLKSGRAKGPIAMLHDGTIVRAGPDRISVWDVGTLDEAEESTDSLPPTRYITFAKHPYLSITGWQAITQQPGTIISYSEHDGDCMTIDLEGEGAAVSQYIGFSGAVTDLSVSEGDPEIFLTACSDGYARLFDLRVPLPVLTFEVCNDKKDSCSAVVLAHPDGIPTVFTGAKRREQIMMWDVRARTPVYELSTGNNMVKSLAWNATRQCLYAATECDYTGLAPPISWPGRAWHLPKFFGHVFHAGGHRIFQYAFKENPDLSGLPKSCIKDDYRFWSSDD